MRHQGRWLKLPALMVLLAMSFPAVCNAQEAPPAKEEAPAEEEAPPTDLVLKGDAVCTRCHDDSSSFPVLAIAKTRHGTLADGGTPTCTSCHGESKGHLEGGPTVKPDRVFDSQLVALNDANRVGLRLPAGKRSTTPAAEQSTACLTCHQDGGRMHWQGSIHDTRNVACSSCHQVHTQHDRVRNKSTQPEVCFMCHKEQRVQVTRASHHPIMEGKVACSDCHNPHGTAGVKLMVRDNVVDTCATCHMEKRGPFIFNHQPVTDDCAICHNPHGSNIASMLKVRQPFLCQQCHEPTSHRGNIPGMLAGTGTSAGTRGITQARACLNCHTNIHGGNNPLNNSESRSMRR